MIVSGPENNSEQMHGTRVPLSEYLRHKIYATAFYEK